MPTSNVTTFNLTSDQLATAAMRKLAVLGDGQSPSTTQLANGTQALNVMLKTFTAKGMPLWVMSEYDLTLTAINSYTFSAATNIPAPIKVTQAILIDETGVTSIPLNIRTHYDFNLLPITDTTGTPTNYWYEPLNQTGVLHVWPTPDTYSISNRVIRLVYQRPHFDMVSGTDTLDFPQWWMEAVIYGLAYRLSPEFGIPLQDRQLIAKEADYFLTEALSFGTEEGSLYLSPDWNR
jgi:hypothetical protein